MKPDQSERRRPSVSHCLPLMGLAASELRALADEGAIQATKRKPEMDMLMKVMMGGWIPVEKRTQWVAFMVAMGAVVKSLADWGTGDMGFVELMQSAQAQWEIFAIAYATYFAGEKIDAVKAEVKKVV